MNEIKRFWDRYFLTLELLTSILIALLVLVWGEFFSGKSAIDHMLGSNRIGIYENLVAVFGTLLGFVITAVSIVLGYINNENLLILRQSERYEDLWKVYKSAMRSLAFATAAGLAGIIFANAGALAYYLIYLNVFTITLAIFRIGRSIWVLENIITLVTKAPVQITQQIPTKPSSRHRKMPKKFTRNHSKV